EGMRGRAIARRVGAGTQCAVRAIGILLPGFARFTAGRDRVQSDRWVEGRVGEDAEEGLRRMVDLVKWISKWSSGGILPRTRQPQTPHCSPIPQEMRHGQDPHATLSA